MADRDTRIRERAHALWEEGGRADGRQDEDWARAAAEIDAVDTTGGPARRAKAGAPASAKGGGAAGGAASAEGRATGGLDASPESSSEAPAKTARRRAGASKVVTSEAAPSEAGDAEAKSVGRGKRAGGSPPQPNRTSGTGAKGGAASKGRGTASP